MYMDGRLRTGQKPSRTGVLAVCIVSSAVETCPCLLAGATAVVVVIPVYPAALLGKARVAQKAAAPAIWAAFMVAIVGPDEPGHARIRRIPLVYSTGFRVPAFGSRIRV